MSKGVCSVRSRGKYTRHSIAFSSKKTRVSTVGKVPINNRMFRTAAIFICLGLLSQTSIAAEEDKAQHRQKRSTEEELTCTDDYATTGICAACADLPSGMSLPFEECCNDEGAQAMCSACLVDVEGCAREMISLKLEELEALKHGYDDNDLDLEESDGLEMSKRYGRMFMGGGGKKYGYWKGDTDKRYGKLFMSGRSYPKPDPYFSEDKRYGTLFMGGRGRSYGTFGLDPYLGEAKRYGKLFMGKRFGQLFLGKSHGKYREGKRHANDEAEDTLADAPAQKRFGRLFLSGNRPIGSRRQNEKNSH